MSSHSTLISTPHGNTARVVLGMLALLGVFVLYRPALDAGFVWDDLLVFQQRAWLYAGDQWKQYIFHGFNNWQHYFRPLGVAAFVLQARLFGGAPEPMHAVSLAMQLVNVALVFVLASRVADGGKHYRLVVPFLAALFFGIHPMLVETVVWIGCQFDQMQVMLALLGLMASLWIRHAWTRAVAVAVCFFLSACFKESAAAYPAIVALFDWLLRTNHNQRITTRLRTLLHEHWRTYTLLLLAGIGYILLRASFMGNIAGGSSLAEFVPNWARLDEMAYVYLKYWAVITGIPLEQSPLHPVEAVHFGESTITALLRLSVGAIIGLIGVLAFSRRFAFTGALVVGASLYLFPVLGFFPGHFDDSLYHERYAIGAIALCAVLLPRAINEWLAWLKPTATLHTLLFILALGWMGWAAASVKVTIPLWSNDLALWQWAAKAHPTNAFARGNLISALIDAGQIKAAREHVQDALDRDLDCDYCYLNGLDLAVTYGDLALADATRVRVRDSANIMHDLTLAQSYWRAVGQLELRLGNAKDAVELLRESIRLEPSESTTYLLLAEALMRDGEPEEARQATQHAIEFAYPPSRADTENLAHDILAGETVFGLLMMADDGAQTGDD